MNNKSLIMFGVLLLLITSGCLSSPNYNVKDSSLSTFPVKSLSLDEKGTVYGDISQDRKIISTAHLQIDVDSVQVAFDEVTNITLKHSGFISSSSMYNTAGRNSGEVTLRVPQKSFYSAIEQIETLGTVKSKQISGQDVTEEFIDLNARLDNLKKQEVRLQEILKTAVTVKDILEVEHELERVRGEIERLTGRLNYLNQSIEMSTITLNAQEPAPFAGEEGWGITDTLRLAVRGFIESVKGIVIFSGYILPILIFIIFIIIAALGIKRKILPLFKI